MVKSSSGQEATAKPVRGYRIKRIGFIGRTDITPKEAGLIWYIGRCIAALGHTVVLTNAKGSNTALREGVEREKGRLDIRTGGIIESSDHTLLYLNPKLLTQVKLKYPDIEERTDIAFIEREQLDEWHDAVKAILTERHVELPA